MATLLLAACSSITTITSPHPGTTVAVREKHLTLPASEKLKGTSFGNYEFKAIETGFEPFYGILPLSFKGGHLAVDIIFLHRPRSSTCVKCFRSIRLMSKRT